MKPKEITVKEPFKRIQPYTVQSAWVKDGQKTEIGLPGNTWQVISQEKLLSELYPSGHVINLRPPKIVRDKNSVVKEIKQVSKIPVALQKLISIKQKIHLATNDISFTLTEPKEEKNKEELFIEFKQAWKDKNMHVAISECIESWLQTGDGAIYLYRNKGKLGWKKFSFHNGDVLFPHYDYYGNLEYFGRMYRDSDKNGREITKLDVFDKKEIVTYTKSGFFGTNLFNSWKEDKNGRRQHGFPDIPICYHRGNDSCWGDVQPLIDSFESCLSNMSENNRYYANLILFMKGKIDDLPNRDDAGKVLVGDVNAEAKFLATPESNQSQTNELDILLKQIFMGSFTVSISPDTVKSSGDLPGITVKLLFSPALEKALDSAKKWDSFIDRMVYLFKYGYGLESRKSIQFESLKLRGNIDIYIPENSEEITRMINDSVFAKSISIKTANEKNPLSVNSENDRVSKQIEEEKGETLNINN